MGLEELPRQKLLEVARLYSSNWLSTDGLWFSQVEEEFGLEAALRLDLKVWERLSVIEASRIRDLLDGEVGGVAGVLRAVNFMTFAPLFGYDLEMLSEGRGLLRVNRCPPQEARVRQGKGEFPCRPVGEVCFINLARVLDPSVGVTCLFCHPDPHPEEAWCQWEFSQLPLKNSVFQGPPLVGRLSGPP